MITNNLNLNGSHAGLKDKDSCALCSERENLRLCKRRYMNRHGSYYEHLCNDCYRHEKEYMGDGFYTLA